MTAYRNALGWAAATVGVAVAGMYRVIDDVSMTTTLLITLPVAGWMAVSERACCALRVGVM